MAAASPYPSIARWTLSQTILNVTLRHLRTGGERDVEAGVLWLGSRSDTSQIEAVVLPRGPGVTEGWGIWRLSPEVLGVVTSWATPRALVLLAIVHIHGGPSVSMSWTDRMHLVHVPGMLSVIVGNGGIDQDPASWGWHLFEDGDYRNLTRTEREERILVTSGGPCTAWEASLQGVKPVVP